MTIKIERDAILSVVNNRQSSSASPDSPSHCYPLSDSYDCCNENENDSGSMGKSYLFDLIPNLNDHHRGELHCQSKNQPPPELDDTDDESDLSSCSETTKGVVFCEPLVTEVRYRPKTLRRNLRFLFYTYEETQRFRQEYREERRLKALEEADSAASTLTGTGASTASSTSTSAGDGADKSVWDGLSGQNAKLNIDDSTRTSHRISTVVVLHKNALETFIDKDTDLDLGILSNGLTVKPPSPSSSSTSSNARKCSTASDNFFDNDSFWSGQVTWY